MFTTLGEPDIKSIGDQAIRLPIDMMKIEIFTRANSRIQYFAASHVSSGHWLSHDFVVITNTGRCGSYDIAPRAHPNDGTLDMMKLNTEMKLQQRVLARHRARTGTHVPHPSINVSRHSTIDLVRHKRARLCLDGVDIKDWKSASITVLADACYIYV
jgi:diacylglycerol kinase family enzyme